MDQTFYSGNGCDNQGSRTDRMSFRNMVVLCLCVIVSPSAWSTVFLQWSGATLPPASSLGVNEIVLAWQPGALTALLASARKQGYRVYVETPVNQATSAAKACAKKNCAGIILKVLESESAETEKSIASLRSAYPKLRVLVLSPTGKQPKMRGSFIIKRNSVLEVSSPTAQPWIDTNLAFITIEQRSRRPQIPLYTFSWADQGPQTVPTADDYSLAVAEAGAFHADLVLQLDEHLQQGLNNHDGEAWALWNQVRSTLKFSSDASASAAEPVANVAVIVDQLDPHDEVANLLSRHNIPFQVFTAADLKTEELKGFDIVIVFAKPDAETAERIKNLAMGGATVVAVDAHGKYSWQNSQPVQLNEHTTSYSVGSGKILELSEPVSDPETFAQDIRRLLGKGNVLLSLWNGLTTIAVPYAVPQKDGGAKMTLLELVNYAGEPVRLQVQVKGSFTTIRYETPEHGCCQSLEPVRHDGFTEFVIPEMRIAGRVHLESQ
jgi:protein-tyrosine-phosphatase